MPQKPFRATTSFCRIPFSTLALPTNQRAHRQQFCAVGSEGVQQRVGRDTLALVYGALVTDDEMCLKGNDEQVPMIDRKTRLGKSPLGKSKRRWKHNTKTDLK